MAEALQTLWMALRRQGAAKAQRGGAWVADRTRRLMNGPGSRAQAGLQRAPAAAAAVAGRARAALSRVRRPARAARSGGTGLRWVRMAWRLSLAALALIVLGAGGTAVALWLGMRDLPLAEVLPPLPEPTIAVTLANGETLTSRGAYRAPYVALDEMPPHLGQAVLAIEDRRFHDHAGVDLRATLRALLRNTRAGGVVQGGSTITQQLVKILYLTPERTLKRKFQEAVLAGMLERQLGKDRILELYLNSAYLGAGAHGAPAAAHSYFGKDVAALSLTESALLAASIQLPSVVNPLTNLEAARARARLVLGLMEEQERIDPATHQQALAELAALVPKPPSSRAGSYFADWVLKELESIRGTSTGGMTARATLNPRLQAEAERIVREVMAGKGAAAGATQAAMVVMSPDGRVRAMVGGLDYTASQFNRATDAKRQPGSTFKVFVYLAALALGADPETRVSDEPITIGDWKPENFDRKSHGSVTLRRAFAASYNLAAVRLAQAVGMDKVIEAARRLGIEGDLQATPSLALGTSEVTLLDMTEAFAGLARGRGPVKATGIETLQFAESGDALGVVRSEGEQTSLGPAQEAMSDLLRAAVRNGTGRAAAVPGLDILGKTGTSQDSRDAWFIGFVRGRGLVVGVWVGNDDNSPMDSVTGGGLPAEMFQRMVTAALKGKDPQANAAPPKAQAAAAERMQCNVRACSSAYRSFRASDCTFQPYSGRRRLCTR